MTQQWPPPESGAPHSSSGPVPPVPQQPFGWQQGGPHQQFPQGPHPQQPAPQQWQAPAGQQPPGMIFLTLQGGRMSANVLAPTVRINGWPVPVDYGMTPIPVPPGRHRIEVQMQWMRTYGQAVLDVEVHPGQQVPVFYAPPFHQFTRGAIGFTHQPRPGLGILLLVLAFALAMFVVAGVAISQG